MKKTFKVVKPNKKSDWSLPSVLENFGCEGLLDEFEKFVPFKMFQQARERLTDEKECLEIKGMADHVAAVKSRGQIGTDITGEHVTILAKFSIKPPLRQIVPDGDERQFVYSEPELLKNVEGKWILGRVDETEEGRDDIFEYTMETLPTYSRIMKSEEILDLVQLCEPRKFNCDFDMKRLPITSRSRATVNGVELPAPYTAPFESFDEMKTHRYQVENIRRSGRVARPEEVIERVRIRGRRVKSQGGEALSLGRAVLRGLLQNYLVRTTDEKLSSYPQMASLMTMVWETLPEGLRGKKSTWTTNDVKNATRGVWEERVHRPHPVHIRYAETLCAALNINWDDARRRLFYDDDVQENPLQVIEVVKFVMNGRGYPRWRKLCQCGKMPGSDDLIRAFPEQVTPEVVDAVRGQEFVAGKRPSSERNELVALFRRLGFALQDSLAFARIIAPAYCAREQAPKNSAGIACVESFVTCLLQPENNVIRPPIWLIKEELGPFGLSEKRYRKIRQDRFIPHKLSNTPANRGQIRRMARSLRLDPEVFLPQLIGSPA